MSQNNIDASKLSSLEAAVLRNLQLMDQRARSDMLSMSAALAEAHPRSTRHTLRLVKSATGGLEGASRLETSTR